MWQRRTFHECAEELGQISNDFRGAYTNRFGIGEQRRNQILQDTSRKGVEILRILALSIRSEQDSGCIPSVQETVGAFKTSVSDTDIFMAINHYRPPYSDQKDFRPLSLRSALNKIAHANPSKSGFFADNDVHDIILCGNYQDDRWIAIISLIDLCRVIEAIPDQNTES